MIYDLKLINDYINAENIPESELEELENNPGFMESVIRISNDKNIYNLCSINVKNDYNFVNFMIDKFSYDLDFIDKVATIFLGNSSDEFMKISIIVKMCNITENSTDKDLFAKYRIMFMARFYSEISSIEIYKKENPNDNEIGLGFMVFYDNNNFDADVIKSYAKELINYLLEEESVELERTLHTEFNNKDDINKYGLNNFIIEFIGRYDTFLSGYAAVHLDVLKGFKAKIARMQSKWDMYVDTEEAYIYELMFSRVHDYMCDSALDSMLTEDEYLYYIGKELGISNKIACYSCMDKEFYDEINKQIDDEYIEKSLKDTRERIIYSNIKKIIVESLFSDKEDNKGKIIKLDFGKQRK